MENRRFQACLDLIFPSPNNLGIVVIKHVHQWIMFHVFYGFLHDGAIQPFFQ